MNRKILVGVVEARYSACVCVCMVLLLYERLGLEEGGLVRGGENR